MPVQPSASIASRAASREALLPAASLISVMIVSSGYTNTMNGVSMNSSQPQNSTRRWVRQCAHFLSWVQQM